MTEEGEKAAVFDEWAGQKPDAKGWGLTVDGSKTCPAC
ncbi:hypothetical protein ADIS_4272 [Lunatimonas lonarensis]|uniref:Uncharacterized protein n=1 Tax=Lunatimonas lonarensis TaxID=1232681 RepID=R7ZLY4_9BACT|nr:hypothetical protein ADIS_4272 [Lunatimonas lonarensis]